MKRRRAMLWLGLALLAGGTMSCDAPAAREDASLANPAQTSSSIPQENKELRILALFDEQTAITDTFRQQHPGIKVEWIKSASASFLDELAADQPPDLIIMDNEVIADLNDMDVFEDLSQPPYEAEMRHAGYPGLKLDAFRSLDGKRLIAVPKDFPLNFTFYRADLLQKYGYPSEPEALAEYMKDPQRWMEMAVNLRSYNHRIFTYGTDPVHLTTLQYGFFSPDGSFPRNSPGMLQALTLSRTISEQGLAANLNIWDESGRSAIRRGEIMMLYMGEWAKNLIPQWDPEHAAEWKMTRLPLGIYGSQGGVSFLMSKYSASKQLAWDYIQHSMKEEEPYLGSMAGRAYNSRVTPVWPTPLDRRAKEIWEREMNKALGESTGKNTPVDRILSGVEDQIHTAISEEMQIMYEMLELSR